jgi:hypothetical protein
MWATYGDNHRGAVIEFSTAPESCPFRDRLAQVFYRSKKIPWGPEDLIDDACKPDMSRLHFLMQFKHADWRDENEWRILFVCDSEMRPDERFVRFPAKAVTRVFIGPRVEEKDELSVRKAVAAHSAGIEVFNREIHQSLAIEGLSGMAELRKPEQFKYWAKRIHGVDLNI